MHRHDLGMSELLELDMQTAEAKSQSQTVYPREESMKAVALKFDSQEDVTKYLNVHFPERKCSDTPGLYELPGNQKFSAIGVHWRTVTVYVREP